ncbi:putative leucine-rich repeat-containing protein DDB_G0281931 [Oscarella lobularis]|uniref:putative leucine-rich repeat-containing protein DDB_G0281931 n=1 Tax=Oscarella lobularis TaxID=121494 RepID=UPI003313E95F
MSLTSLQFEAANRKAIIVIFMSFCYYLSGVKGTKSVERHIQTLIRSSASKEYGFRISSTDCDSPETNRTSTNSSLLHREERSVLLQLYIRTNGPCWTNRCGWNTSRHYCMWYGIVCDETERVQEISLISNNLFGVLPPSVLKLRHLKIFMVSQNALYGDIGAVLPRLPPNNRLRHIALSFNNFSGIVPWKNISTYGALYKLQLSCNENISGNLSDDVGSLRWLGVLSLGQTKISGHLPLRGLTKMKSLYFLDFEDLRLRGNITKLPALPRLFEMNLMGNRLTGTLPLDFGNKYPKLENIFLKENKITGTLPDIFQQLVNLQTIDVSSNYLHGTIPVSLLTHQTVGIIDASYNRFTWFDMSPSSFKLPNLRVIRMASNPLSVSFQQVVSAFRNVKHLQIMDFSACNLSGHIPLQFWNTNAFGFGELVSINISHNQICGPVPKSATPNRYLGNVDLSNNYLWGPLSNLGGFLYSLSRYSVLNNPLLKTDNLDRPLPAQLIVDDSVRIREQEHDNFSCPQIKFNTFPYGIVLMNSSYYGKVLCRCDEGYFGHRGRCRLCPNGGTCRGSQKKSLITIKGHRYPSPSPKNMTKLIQCRFSLVGKNRCNPFGNCTCWLSDNGTVAECNESCLCATHSFNRLCSQCRPGAHLLFDRCIPCSHIQQNIILFSATVGAVLLLLVAQWILNLFQPCCLSSKTLQKINIGTVFVQAIILVSLVLSNLIPSYIAEGYFLVLVLVIVSYYRVTTVTVLATTLIFYFQILGKITTASIDSTDDDHYTFASFLHHLGVYKVLEAVNLNFSGLACLFPILYKPLGKLVSLGVLPIILGTILLLGQVINYQVAIRWGRAARRSLRYHCHLRSITNKNVKRNFIFLFNIVYFPVASNAIEVFVPCNRDPDEDDAYMRAFPWIRCGSTLHRRLVAVAAALIATYGCCLPIIYALLLAKYAKSAVKGSTKTFAKAQEWLRPLCDPYKPKYRRTMPVVLMLRRLAAAVVLSVFNKFTMNDIERLLFGGLVVASVTFVVAKRPYKAARGELENYVDAAAFAVLLVTYDTTRNQPYTSTAGATATFAVNVVYVVTVVALLIWYVWLTIRRRRAQKGEPMQTRGYGTAESH